MIHYKFNENNPFDTALAVNFGSKEEAWLENMLADMHAMLNAVINVTVTKYVPDENEQEVAIGVIKSFIIDDLIESDTDLKGFKDIVLGGQQGEHDLIDTTAIEDWEEGDSH